MDFLLAGLPGAALAFDLGQVWTVLDVELRVALAARRAQRAAPRGGSD